VRTHSGSTMHEVATIGTIQCGRPKLSGGCCAVLVQPSGGAGGSQFVLAAHATSDQLARMNELAVEALQRWKQADHPGWSVTEADSDTFLARLHQVKVRAPGHSSAMLCCAVMQAAMLCCAVMQTAMLCCAVMQAAMMCCAVMQAAMLCFLKHTQAATPTSLLASL